MRPVSTKIGPVEHLPSKVVSFVMREISIGNFRPGEQLPTEHKLASTLGVSRNVIREAISQLRADGVVQARQGVGAFIMEPERRSAIRLDTAALNADGSMKRLFELRGILEIEAAGLAAIRRNKAHLKKIKQALEIMSGKERWEEGSIEADLVFHREIARATGNDYIYTFVCFICEQIRRSIHIARYTNSLPEIIEINVHEHVRIYAALEAGDAEAARESMRNHLEGAAKRAGAAPKRGTRSAKNKRIS